MSNLSAQSRKLHQLSVGEVLRSSLAQMNSEKLNELYEVLFGWLSSHCRLASPRCGFRFESSLYPLYPLDSTVVDLCLSMFPWTIFRRTKDELKMHVALNHAGYLTGVCDSDGRQGGGH